ncbi:MAG: hypothetical protein LBE06_05960 [Azoarcus sp.]|jgi:hypothetical protein|nr:hypothetical protein [Azoarcus sp.]
MDTKLSPILSVVRDILYEDSHGTTQGMHINEIAKIAVNQNRNFGLSEEKLAEKIGAALSSHARTKKPIFSKVSGKRKGTFRRGFYRLKRGSSTDSSIIKVIPPSVNTLYSGKAGEYAVASELLFWGFNVSTMAVDQGVDLIAEKEGKFHYIQVKTSTKNASLLGNTFGFGIEQKAFDDNLNKKPFYIFVMREDRFLDYAVIPNALLEHLRATGVITGRTLSVQITRDARKRQYKLNGQDINTYINNFILV